MANNSRCTRMIICFLALLLALCFAQSTVPITVKTTNGYVQGLQYTAGGYNMFKGIPYASPPTGSLRWQPPVPAPSWAPNILNATEFGPGCMQQCMEPKGICPVVISEDCLYLNVWTPANVTKALPVMVFFPGGNYRQDAASTDLYWGEYFPSAGQIVLVTVNYRLGALGFLVAGGWTNGNLGLKDQVLALQWVQQNIAPFGGDPSSVTIFGQSAGAESVIFHLYSPDTMGKNLFHRAICMSGSLGIAFKDQKEQITLGEVFAKRLGCEVTSQACFLNKTSSDILAAQLATKELPWPNTFMKAYEWSPTVGSEEVPYQALDGLKTGNFTPVPIILGSLLEEGVQFVDLLFTSPMEKFEYDVAIAAVFGEAAFDILQAYPCTDNMSSDCRPVMAQIATHKVFSCPTRNAARTMGQLAPLLASSIYIYFYDHPLSFPGWGANFSYCNGHVCHGSELPVLYNSATSYGFQFQPDELTLALQMEQFWGSFANGATGPLSVPSSNVVWPVYNATGSYTLQLNTPALQVQQGRLNTLCDMWDKIGYY